MGEISKKIIWRNKNREKENNEDWLWEYRKQKTCWWFFCKSEIAEAGYILGWFHFCKQFDSEVDRHDVSPIFLFPQVHKLIDGLQLTC